MIILGPQQLAPTENLCIINLNGEPLLHVEGYSIQLTIPDHLELSALKRQISLLFEMALVNSELLQTRKSAKAHKEYLQ
jgi:hypothetical protein